MVLCLKLLCKILLIFHLQLSVYLMLRGWLSSSHDAQKGPSFLTDKTALEDSTYQRCELSH